MHLRSRLHRRSSLFTFALAAALSAESATLLQRADAVSASASEAAYQPAVSPRELGGSIPAAPTIRTVAVEPAPGPREVAPREDTSEPRARRRQAARDRRQRRGVSEREDTTVAERRSTRRSRVVRDDSTKDTSKDRKNVVIPPPASDLTFTLSGGWQSRYIFHGLDIISFNSRYRNSGLDRNFNPISPREESSSIWFTDFSLNWKGLRAGVSYVQATDPTVPFFQFSLQRGRVTSTGLLNDRVRLYREVDVHIDYTFSIVPQWLDATVGYNSYFFPNHDFKGTSYQGEIPIRLTFTRIPYIRPSFTYYRYLSDYKRFEAGNLNGNYVEFRLDAGFPLYTSANFAVSLAPYALASYNINYLKFSGNDDIGGFNTFETGLKVPIRIGKRFTVTPFGNFGANLSNADLVANSFAASNVRSSSGSRSFGEQTQFWGGVNVAFSF